MNTQKAAYWLALAVFGLVLHSEYGHGSFPAVHRVADRASFTLCRLATHAERAVALARLIAIRPQLEASQLLAAADATELTDSQAELLREQVQNEIELRRVQVRDNAELLRGQTYARVDMIRALVDVRRAQLDQARSRMRAQIFTRNSANRRLVAVRPVDCSKTRTQVAVIGSHVSSDGDEDSD
jgi:hypothetical protein